MKFYIIIAVALSHCCNLSLAFHLARFSLPIRSLELLNAHNQDIDDGPIPLNANQAVSKQLNSALKFMVSLTASLGAIQMTTSSSRATTYFDTDVYGDKELKIATVNKLKQKLRNAILSDPTIAAGFLQLSVNDALGYDARTKDGGADGSILLEMDQSENKPLQKVKDIMLQIQKELQRTNTLSFADVCAFAGSEALESVGCGRVTVQIGRYDAKSANKKINSKSLPWSEECTDDVGSFSAFQSSGLDVKDAVLLLSALGEVQRVVNETLRLKNVNNDEEDETFESEPFVPSTFGARDAIFGAKVGAGDFGTKYVMSILKNQLNPSDSLGKCLIAQSVTKPFLSKYIGNDISYRKDVADAYTRLTQVGEAYTTRNS